MPNDIYGELIACDMMNYALVTSDTTSGYTAGAVSFLAPLAEIAHDAKVDVAKRYYDNKLRFVTITEGDTEVKVTVSGVPCVLASVLTGKPYDATKGIFIDTGDAADTPWAALSGRMGLGDGGYRYFQYLKGKFALGAQKAKTKEDKTSVNTTDLTYTAVITNYAFTMPDASAKSIKGIKADTTDSAFTTAASWFSQVQTPATVTPVSAIALSTCVPANNATAIAITVVLVLTFNNAIASDSVTLLKVSDNSVVAVAKAYDTTGKILTITPSANLTAAAVYNIVIAGAKDIYGQILATVINKFTCA